ncbi:hypothetical protein Acin_2314 [Acidaminococcus intestini RyC-MR95]|uniref:Uncharacterized protein n=1 Tax=Acidaminococcus intestini (strain RyC-MR95) TaxID=568816 RepID=G4Q724_ACIIR|nr:hypothetical protein Acin_2314 [Acidaminococcus intestini RyC-MR95]
MRFLHHTDESRRHAQGSASFQNRSLINSHLTLHLHYTLLRLGGRQPLCGIGVTSLMDSTSRPAACSARIAASRPAPGPLTKTSILFRPCSIAALAAVSAAI